MRPAISPQSLRVAGIALLVLYLVAGGIYSFLQPAQARFGDEQEYFDLSIRLAAGQGYSLDGVQPTAFRPPGYPFFLAAIKIVGGGFVAIRIVQYLLVAATILLIVRMTPERDRFAGLLVVTGLVAIYPILFYTSGTLYAQTLSAFLFILAVALLIVEKRSFYLNLFNGLTFGFLILAIPTFLLTLLVALAVSWILKMIRPRDAIVIFAGAFILIGSWTLRNAVVLHHFVPFSTNSGTNFLLGNCENTVPNGGIGNIDIAHYFEAATQLHLDEYQADNYYREQALKWITHHPGRAALLYLEKAANFFNLWNEYAPTSQPEVSPWKQLVTALSYLALLALLAWRLTEVKRFPLLTREKLFLAVYLLSAFTMAIFITRIRFRLPYDYLIIAIIAIHLQRRLRLWLEPGKPISAG